MKSILTLFALFFQLVIFSQSNTITTGKTASGSTGTATYSIGQIDYQTNSGTLGTISQGVQQAFEIVTLSANDIPQIQLTASVYPNPTVQNVTLSIKEYDVSNLQYVLFDLQGKVIIIGKITGNETQIKMTDLASSQYFLKITQSNQELKTFKIIKK